MTDFVDEWDELKPQIDKAVAKGKTSLFLSCHRMGVNFANYLREKGYNVETNNDHIYTYIRWEYLNLY